MIFVVVCLWETFFVNRQTILFQHLAQSNESQPNLALEKNNTKGDAAS